MTTSCGGPITTGGGGAGTTTTGGATTTAGGATTTGGGGTGTPTLTPTLTFAPACARATGSSPAADRLIRPVAIILRLMSRVLLFRIPFARDRAVEDLDRRLTRRLQRDPLQGQCHRETFRISRRWGGLDPRSLDWPRAGLSRLSRRLSLHRTANGSQPPDGKCCNR